MNKLEVGMYVRTEHHGILKTEKIYKQNGEYVIAIYDKDGHFVDITEIIGEPSYNIIDLIEEGDYVNGNRVVEHAHEPGRLFVENIYVGGKGQTTIENYSYELTSKYCYDETDFIKSIVTKEQFENAKYKIGE